MMQSRQEILEKVRPQRVSVNEQNRNKITVKGLNTKDFYFRWVNERDDRLDVFREAGYNFVHKGDQHHLPSFQSKVIETKVGDGGVNQSAGVSSRYTKGMGRGVTAHLMALPMEFYIEDQKKKQREVDELEADIKRSAREKADYGEIGGGQLGRLEKINQAIGRRLP